jgi:hypothetical protein
MRQYTDGSGWSAVQMIGLLLTARPRWVCWPLADRRSRAALAVADVADAATGGGDAPESRGLVALARHNHAVAPAVDWLAGDRRLPPRVLGSLIDAGAVHLRSTPARLWRPRRAEPDPATLSLVQELLRSRPPRAVVLALAAVEVEVAAPAAVADPMLSAARADPLYPALRTGAAHYLRRRASEDATAAAAGGVAAG